MSAINHGLAWLILVGAVFTTWLIIGYFITSSALR